MTRRLVLGVAAALASLAAARALFAAEYAIDPGGSNVQYRRDYGMAWAASPEAKVVGNKVTVDIALLARRVRS